MTKTKTTKGCGFDCMECGYKFLTTAAAQRAMIGPNGCPKCGGSDIDIEEANPAQYPGNSIGQVWGRQ